MDYELRPLAFDDVFTMVNIISKIGVEEIQNCFKVIDIKALVNDKKKNSSEAITKIGAAVVFNLVGLIMKNINSCKADLYSFMGSMVNLEAEEIRKMPPAKAFEILIAIFKADDFMDFFKVALKLLNSEN